MNKEELLAEARLELSAGQVCAALELFGEAEQAGADADDCASGRWTCHMLRGEFEKAWLESDAISLRGNPDTNRFWDGQPVTGKHVLMRCLHGLGDTIQFIRYAALVRRHAKSVTIEAQPLLKELLKQSNLADRVITWGEIEPEWDQQIEVVELPRIFRTTLQSIPQDVPYLFAPPEELPLSAANGQRSRLQVGLVWASSIFNPARSIALRDLTRLLETPGIQFYGLQAGPERFELREWTEGIPDLYQEGASVLSTARVVQALDLLITVDTMTAHLAGALGKPVWTLLPFECDWRWMRGREDSPWYPTMRLFRQTKPGDWGLVIGQVRAALLEIAATYK